MTAPTPLLYCLKWLDPLEGRTQYTDIRSTESACWQAAERRLGWHKELIEDAGLTVVRVRLVECGEESEV